MGSIEIVLQLFLVALLGVTMLHAIRLQRAIASLRHDRAALADAVAGFEAGTRHAEAGLARLRDATDSLAAQYTRSAELRDDLVHLFDRGEPLADRLDKLVREGRAVELPAAPVFPSFTFSDEAHPEPLDGLSSETIDTRRSPAMASVVAGTPLADVPRVRSSAERNLLVAMQARS